MNKIPQKMSFFWGAGPMSWARYLTLYSFRKHNPGWEMTLYRCDTYLHKTWTSHEATDGDVPQWLDYSACISALDVAIKPWSCPQLMAPAPASDLFTWQILSTLGGYYSDMDILYVRPMDSIVAQLAECSAGFCAWGTSLAIGLLAARPGSPIFATIAQTAQQNYIPTDYQSAGVDAIYAVTGTKYNVDPCADTLSALAARFSDEHICQLPAATVYPWTPHQVEHIFCRCCDVPAATVGIHWYGGSPLSQSWNRRLDHTNYRQYTNTFARYAGECCADLLE